ncbi:MAG: UDP-N-acetylglucosamine 2-epimerase (non-hydrolyzing), partial [Ktedonobacterales bacterium]
MKFVSIVGARPQFIKLAPVSRAVREAGHDEVIVHTGQHYDERLSGTFFSELGIPQPDYNLEIGSGQHGAQTGQMLTTLEATLQSVQPDGVIVFGDTNSTLAGALAAVKLHIPVAHVEAGLRSFDRRMPEEINRVVTDHVSARLFCPTQAACDHLRAEGITRGVEVVGDVMYDVLRQAEPQLAARAETLLPGLGITSGAYTLATIHRAANTDDPQVMARLAQGLSALDMPVIFPVHPRTRKLLDSYGVSFGANVRQVAPVGYLDMLALQRYAHRIVTDSGGVQKEAFLLRVPCVTLRDTTEWTETVEVGWNTLVGSDPQALLDAFHRPTPPRPARNPYGEGDAAER